MAEINQSTMLNYLNISLSSINQNKINGILAEIDLRNTLSQFNFGTRISQGGWIMRNVGNGTFGHSTIVIFPQTIQPNTRYVVGRNLPDPELGLHTICSTMHQIGVHSYYAVPSISITNDTSSITWNIKQLGIPYPVDYTPLNETIRNFQERNKRYNFLRYHSNASIIPANSIPDEFTKEHIRVTFQSEFMSEISDIDGILWGQQYTYPIEIKEKTVAFDKKIGYFFGIDVGPFVKLAFYAAKKGNLHSLFFVREIDNTTNRQLINWWFITFERLATFASWIPKGGGTNMSGGRSTVVQVPRSEFSLLTRENISAL